MRHRFCLFCNLALAQNPPYSSLFTKVVTMASEVSQQPFAELRQQTPRKLILLCTRIQIPLIYRVLRLIDDCCYSIGAFLWL